MALSTELLKRLNSSEEPLPKRLKLAENVFYTVDIPIVRKEDLILQWLCKTCSVEDVWSCLKNCLKAKHFDIKVDVKKLLVDALVEKFEEDIQSSEDLFECTRLLIANNGMQQYFINKPEDLGFFIKSLLDCVLKLYKHVFKEETSKGIDIALINKSNELIFIAYNTTISVLESIIQIFKSAFTAKDNLRTVFIHDILYPLCAIIDHKCTDNTNRLGAVAHKCVQHIIFGKRHAQSETVLKNNDAAAFTVLLSTLTKNIETKDLESNVTTFVFIFRAAVGIFKSNNTTLDLILRELVECAGTYKKQILNSLLKQLNDMTLNFDNVVRSIKLFDYCLNVIDDISSSSNMNSTDYELLIQFSYINPLLIEKKIQDILRKAFTERPVPQYTNLMISILDASLHMRQEEKIISSILIALKHSLNEVPVKNASMFFPQEFKEKFMKSVNNITNSQGVNMLRTLIYHLNTDCMEVLQSNDICKGKNIFIVQATVELLVTLLDGICIFEYSGTLTSHQKFINVFNDLGNVLSRLMDRVLHLNHSKKVIVLLLAAIFSWNETQKALKYYVPKAVTQDLKSPLSHDHWQQLIQRITNFGKDSCKSSMNKLILQQVKTFQNAMNESPIKLNSLVGGLEYYWDSILKFDTDIVSILNKKEIAKVTSLLLTDMTSNMDNFREWIKVLKKSSLQENKKFVLSLLSCVVAQIGCLITEGVTKSISAHFSTICLLEEEMIKNEKMSKIILSIREELLKDKWVQIENTYLCKIKTHLEILLHIPLMFLNTNIRLITFMFIFALRKECDRNDGIISVCNTLVSDLLEKPGINTFEYIDPSVLLNQLPQNRIVQKCVEQSLRNGLSYSILKKLVKTSTHSKKNMYFLLESMEYAKSKLNVDQKATVKKVEKKLSKVLIETLPSTITEADDIKILSLILKINIVNEEIDENLKNVAESTLHNIFMGENDKAVNKLLQDGFQLAIIILHNRKLFKITKQITKGMWCALFKYPCTDVLLPLLESSEPKEFNEFLEHLHDEMVNVFTDAQDHNLENICIIWNAILKTSMSSDRSKLRVTAINKLIQTSQTVYVPEKFWPSILKLIQNILATKHLHLPGNTIDMTIFLGIKSLQETTILICNDVLTLCNVLLKTRTSLITDRLPTLLILYKEVLNIFVHKSKTMVNKSEEHVFKCLALDVEKFVSSLIKLKKDMIRLSPYLIADLLQLYSEPTIAIFVKVCIQNCISQLISICDQHGIALLSRTLPISMQEIFKTQLDVFNKFYKFSGKI